MKIKNYERLLVTGDTKSRSIVLGILESALCALDGKKAVANVVSLEDDTLRIGYHAWDLRLKRRIIVLGAGKACAAMARGIEDKLGDRISEGLVLVKSIEPDERMQRIELVQGGHPIPNAEGLEATRRILAIVDNATSEDLFIVLISGGSSSLMTCPLAGITLPDEIVATRALVESGARILEINAVRRHISETNGGRLAQKIEARGTEVIALILSDVVQNPLMADRERSQQFFGTPIGADDTTIQDALDAIDKYGLRHRMPQSIIDYLDSPNLSHETPKELGSRIQHLVLQTPSSASEAAKHAALRSGLPTLVLTTVLEGESREAGTFLACVAKEIMLHGRPMHPPCILIASGETTTRAVHASGLGGPSQELALGLALEIDGLSGCCVAALDTDGTDGPTDFAGGLADSTTAERARSLKLDIYGSLMRHDSTGILLALGDELVTGNTGTNVCDLNIIYVPARVVCRTGVAIEAEA